MSKQLIPFRTQILRVAVWWVTTGVLGSLLSAIGHALDMITSTALASVYRRFPGYRAPHDAIPTIAAERRLRRGLGETVNAFAVRLRSFRQAHWTRGGPYALLAQIRAQFEHWIPFQVELVYRSGRRFTMAADGTIVRDTIDGWDFQDGPDNAERWARWCLIYRTNYEIPISDEEIAAVPREWNAAHCEGYCTILVLTNGVHVWNEPGLSWDDVGLSWYDEGAIPGTVRVIQGV